MRENEKEEKLRTQDRIEQDRTGQDKQKNNTYKPFCTMIPANVDYSFTQLSLSSRILLF